MHLVGPVENAHSASVPIGLGQARIVPILDIGKDAGVNSQGRDKRAALAAIKYPGSQYDDLREE
jgi:hypothetical protein